MSNYTSFDEESKASTGFKPQEGTWEQLQAHIETAETIRDAIVSLERTGKNGDVEVSKLIKALKSSHDSVIKKLNFSVEEEREDENKSLSMADILRRYWEVTRRKANVVTSGFKDLDDMLGGGWEEQRLVILAAPPNVGKTTLAHMWAETAAFHGRPVLYMTTEDTPTALTGKTIARLGKIPYDAVSKGYPEYETRINDTIATLLQRESAERLIYLDGTESISLAKIRKIAREHFDKYSTEKGGGPGIIVMDYLQELARRVSNELGSVEPRIINTAISQFARSIAIELHCTVIAISSINRSSYERSGSATSGVLSAMKESGDIEYATDVALSLYEEKKDDRNTNGLTPMTLYVDKNRQGKRNVCSSLDFYGEFQQFTPSTFVANEEDEIIPIQNKLKRIK